MITYFISLIFIGLIAAIISPLSLLPNATLPAALSTGITQIGGFVSVLNAIFPVVTLIEILSSVIAVEVAIFTYKIIYWIIKKIPTIS